MPDDRVLGRQVTIDDDAVRRFFDRRGRSADPEHLLTSVLYQDQNPNLAYQRDAHEKAVALPLLQLSAGLDVLDVGCGVARWAEPVCEAGARYVGVDYSASLLEHARNHAPHGATFHCASVTELDRNAFATPAGFDRIIMAGVLIYLNDDAAVQGLTRIAECAAPQSLVYLREPMGLISRLSLDGFWSADLDTDYSAIYRTREELLTLIGQTLGAVGFTVERDEALYPEHLNNRAETQQRYFVIRRDARG